MQARYLVISARLFACMAAACGGSGDDDAGGASGAGAGSGGSVAVAGSDGAGAGGAGLGASGSLGAGSGGGDAGGAGAAAGAGGGPVVISSGGCPTVESEVQSGMAAAGFAQLFAPMDDFAGVREIELGADHVYFVADAAIQRVPKAGGSAELVYGGGVLSLLVTATDLFWSEPGADAGTYRIVKATLGVPPAPVDVATGLNAEPKVLTSDGSFLYYVQVGGGVGKVTLAGGEVVRLGGVLSYDDIALIGENVYGLSGSGLMQLPTMGGPPTEVAQLFFGGEIASDGTDIFWADGSEGTIKKWAMTMMGTLLATKTDGFSGWPETLTASQGVAYWSEGKACGQVYRVAADGSGHAMIMEGFSRVKEIAVDDSGLYVADEDGLYRMDKP